MEPTVQKAFRVHLQEFYASRYSTDLVLAQEDGITNCVVRDGWSEPSDGDWEEGDRTLPDYCRLDDPREGVSMFVVFDYEKKQLVHKMDGDIDTGEVMFYSSVKAAFDDNESDDLEEWNMYYAIFEVPDMKKDEVPAKEKASVKTFGQALQQSSWKTR